MSGQAEDQDRRSRSAKEKRSAGVTVSQCLSVSHWPAAGRSGKVQRAPAVHPESVRCRRVEETVSWCAVRQFPRQVHQNRYSCVTTSRQGRQSP